MCNVFTRRPSRTGVSITLSMVLGCALAFLPSALAQQGAPRVVVAHVALSSGGAHPGSTMQATVVGNVAAGYHINAHKPSFDYLIPTTVKFESNSSIAVEKAIYPAGKPVKLPFSNHPLSVYEGKFLISLVLKVAAGVSPGAYTLKGKLGYQACNDRACLAPMSVPLTLAVKVVRRSAEVH